MQNSCTFGEVAKAPYRISIPRKEQKDPEAPEIRSRITHGFSDRDMEWYQYEQADNYKVFVEQPMKKADKRSTCIRKGSAEYGTL